MSVKIHILGASGHAGRKHREAIEQLPELYTITDYDDADIIDICTPNWLHVEQAVEALEDDKSCILEKPFAADIMGLIKLDTAELLNEGRVYPVLNYRSLPIGLYDGIWHRPHSYYEGWRGKRETALGGVILSHGIHSIDYAICEHGRVSLVSCSTWHDPTYDGDVETKAGIALHFESGHSLSMHLEITPDANQSAHPNPGYLDFFRNLDKAPRLSELYHLQEVLDACYAAARSSSIIRLSSAALTA